MRRAALLCAVIIAVPVAPARAGTGGADGITVTIADVVLSGYGCSSAQVTVRAAAPVIGPWVLAVSAGPVGRDPLDRLAFAGIGAGELSGPLLVCPADSSGDWVATVDSQTLTGRRTYPVAFTVRKLSTTTTVRSARATRTTVRVKGSVTAENGVPGRATLAVRGLRDGIWRLLGYTNARDDGRFRFVAPGRVRRVLVEYQGDAATMPSSAGTKVARISTSSSP